MNYEEVSLSASVKFVPDKSCLSTREHGDIHLTPNERRLLELIINGRNKKEIIFEEIWHSQGTIVSESSYHQLIKMLRRKLEQAGLPGSIIKTIPRYGIVLVPDETLAESGEEESADTEPTSLELCGDGMQPELSTAQPRLFSSFAARLLLIFSVTAILLPSLCIPLFMKTPHTFQEVIRVDSVTFHFFSGRSPGHVELMKMRQALPAGVDNVYIASNGPKVFTAQCEGELLTEGKCSYEYYSSY